VCHPELSTRPHTEFISVKLAIFANQMVIEMVLFEQSAHLHLNERPVPGTASTDLTVFI
jgi:hypothetical protein